MNQPLVTSVETQLHSFNSYFKSKKKNHSIWVVFFLAPQTGLEPVTPRLTAACSTDWAIKAKYFTTLDNLRWYCVGIALSSRAASSQVLSALMSLTTVFGMGTGGPSSLKTPTIWTIHPDFSFQWLCHIMVTRTRFELVLPAWEAGVLGHLTNGPFNGTPSRTRTVDTLIKSQVLYQLS